MGGPEADDAAVCGWADDGSNGLGAKRQWHEARRDRRRGAATGSAWRVANVMWVDRGSWCSDRELRRHRLAGDHHTSFEKPAHDRGLRSGNLVGRHVGASMRWKAVDVDDVLDSHGNSVQGTVCGLTGCHDAGAAIWLRKERPQPRVDLVDPVARLREVVAQGACVGLQQGHIVPQRPKRMQLLDSSAVQRPPADRTAAQFLGVYPRTWRAALPR